MQILLLLIILINMIACGGSSQEGVGEVSKTKDVTLIWDANAVEDQVTEYRVYYGVETECSEVDPLVIRVGISEVTTFVHKQIPLDGKVRCWEVTAFNGLESDHSNRASDNRP